jgi:chorismate mutase
MAGCARPAGTRHGASPGGGAPAARSALDGLLGLMRERLLVQHEVARAKWHARLAITDPRREQQLLDRAEAQARGLGLEPGFAREFFRAQIAAGKRVQRADFDAWRRGEATPPAAGPDLRALRRRIDGLNRRLLEALKDAGPLLRQEAGRKELRARADAVLRGEGITAEVRRAACAPLLGQ